VRIRTAVILIVVSLVSAITISVTGQEEALPVVRAKDATDAAASNPETYALLRPEPTLYLAVEPIRELPQLTLAQAARNNDWVTFHDLYVKAQNRGEDVSQFQSLHELWSWSLSDPIGAFYGREIYDRLARAYPGFPGYISEFVLIDRKGNTFYPTAETRAFLLDRATRGDAPRVLIAEESPRALPKVTPKPATRVATTSTATEAKPQPRVAARKPVTAAKPAPVVQKPAPAVATAADPLVVETPPVVITPQPLVAEQPKVAVEKSSPAPVPAPVPAVTQPVAEPAPTATAAIPESNDLRNRGILLLIIGLLGVGILAVILRAPKEEPRPLDLSQKVHPIHKPGTDEHRATGSHG
jgi:hypothetical protein